MAPYGIVTLLTSDAYLAGALTAIHSVLDVEGVKPASDFDTVCLVTPSTVGQDAIKALEKTFDQVIGVEMITTESWQELKLLGREDLAHSLTKLHLFRLTQFEKVVFLDADTLVLRPLTPLFALAEPFSAAPDQGWPDAFNSGVMVATPSLETFDGLIDMMRQRGTWDGGDQGLLNDFFPNWNRLSFTFNVTPSAYYTYAPAYRRHGQQVSVLHFIGQRKPWHRGTRDTYVPDVAQRDYYGLVNQWFDVYERHFGLAHTSEVASRVVQPPSSFKSTYVDLPAYAKPPSPPPIVAPVPVHAADVAVDAHPPLWDPARSSPPRDSKHMQMQVPFTDHYENIWDDPNKKRQRVRFQAPKTYPPVPKETHEWYKDIMGKAPDPTAVRPVFPWEHQEEPQPPSRSFPPSEAPRTPPVLSSEPAQSEPLYTRAAASTFTNAWDDIPGIKRYARSLAKMTSGTSSTSRLSAGRPAATDETGLGGRASSLREPKPFLDSASYERKSDASSRDGDDEDEETNSSEDDRADQVKIVFRQRDKSLDGGDQRQGSAAAGTEGWLGGGGGTVTSPGSPSRPRHSRQSSGGSLGAASPRLRHHHGSLGSTSAGDAHFASASSLNKPNLRLNTSATLPSLPATSPRLAAQALRNSAAARVISSGAGTGDGPPLVRATRVFSPDTDTAVVKTQRLATLQRFVETMEAAGHGSHPSGGGDIPPSQEERRRPGGPWQQ